MIVALTVAVAGAGLAGFVISRPQATPRATTPIGSPALAADTLASTIGYTAAANPGSKQVVVFGGDLTLAQTWLWSGSRWKLAHPRTSPSGREEAAAAYDPELHMVLLFGGIQPPETFLGDTWGWDGSTWHLLDSGSIGPPPGQASMAWDPALDTMVLMPASSSGADTWTWSGTHWVDHRQPDPYLPTGVLDLAFNPATQVLMGVGFGSVVSGGYGAPTETWTWNGASWSQLSTRVVPSAYGILGLGWDPISARLLLFGEGPATLVPLLRWEWNGTDWVQLPSLSSPSVIEGHVTGGETSALLLVGELSEATAATPIRVWSWDGTAWGPTTSTTVPAVASAKFTGHSRPLWVRRLFDAAARGRSSVVRCIRVPRARDERHRWIDRDRRQRMRWQLPGPELDTASAQPRSAPRASIRSGWRSLSRRAVGGR